VAKNKKSEIIYDGIHFDSNEEVDFYHWCLEAKKYKIISEFSYNTTEYNLSPKQTLTVTKQLKTKIKEIEKSLLNPHSYTPDFNIIAGERWELMKNSKLISTHDNNTEYVIDVKGSFQLHDGSRSFSINCKWMYDKYGIYINKVVPEKFFKLTWLPEKCKLSPKKRQIRKKYIGVKTLYEKYGSIGV